MRQTFILMLIIPLILAEATIYTLRDVVNGCSTSRDFESALRDVSAYNATSRGIDKFLESILEAGPWEA